MAVTKIINIKAHPQKAVDYICDKNKTETKENILIDSEGCGIHSIKYDFERIHKNCYQNKNPKKVYTGNLAYHLIQSFEPGEVSPELAHQIGKEYANKVLEGKYSYVISTHVNRGHIHNHIIFCSTDNFAKGRYNDCTKERYRREHINDEICREYGLSTIDKTQGRNKKTLKYDKWEYQNQKTDWKTEYINDIEQCINLADSYKEFLELMKNKGYGIDDRHKHITFTSEIYGKKIRGGTLKNKNREDYSRENIQKKILEKVKSAEQAQHENSGGFAIPPEDTKQKEKKQMFTSNKPYIVNVNEDKFKNAKGLNRWVHRHNMQSANDLLNFAQSLGFTTIKSVYLKLDAVEQSIKSLENDNEKKTKQNL